MTTAFERQANRAWSRVSSAYTPADGHLTVTSTARFVAPGRVTVFTGSGSHTENVLTILRFTEVVDAHTLTIDGPVEGYSDVALPVNAYVEQRATAAQYDALTTAINDLEDAGVTIGGSVSGGSANSVLYVDGGTDLANSANLTFDGSKLAVKNQVVVTMANAQSNPPLAIKNNSNVAVCSILSTGQIVSPNDGVGAQFGRYEINGPTNPGLISCLTNNFVAYAPSSFKVMLETAGANIEFGSFNLPKIVSWGKHAFGSTTANAQIHVTAASNSTIGAIVQGTTTQSAALVSLRDVDATPLTEFDKDGYGLVHRIGFALATGTDMTTGTNLIAPAIPAPFNGKIVKWKAIAGTNGSSGGFSFDVKKNGTTIFSAAQTVSANTTSVQSGTTFATTSVSENDLFNIDVTAAGSGVQNVRIELYILVRNK